MAGTTAVAEAIAINTETGRFLGLAPSNSPEWHEMRRLGIGGSHVGTILGLSKWDSPYSLWARKTGRLEPTPQTEPMEWGHRIEPVIIDKFEEEHPELEIIRDVGTWCHRDRSWQIANPDALFVDRETGEWGVLEIKMSRYDDDFRDGPPRNYRAQVQWYMNVLGFERAVIAALFGGNQYREFEVDANEFEQEILIERAADFRRYLEEDREPDFDGSTATYEAVRAVHPEIEPKSQVEVGTLGRAYLDAIREAEVAESRALELKSRLMAEMGSAQKATMNGEVIAVRQARGTGRPFLAKPRG